MSELQLVLQDVAEESDTPEQGELEQWSTAALDAASQMRRCLTLRLVNEGEMQSLNATYRDHDYPTNVLSFPFDGPVEVEPDLLGDIVICPAVIRREALEQGKPLEAHWAHMVVHGILHLCGFDHTENKQAESMEALEVNILGKLGISDPYLVAEESAPVTP